MSVAPATEPITMPAIWPPDSPWSEEPAAAVEFEVEVEEGTIGGKVAVDVGSVTSAHRLAALEFEQQESVELGELDEQYPHRPTVFGP